MKKIRIFVLLSICLAAMYLFTGCGVSHSSPEGVVRSLVKYYEKGSEKKVKDCYGIDGDADAATKAEIESTIQYFKTMKSKGITLTKCDIIQEYENYTYIYISYKVDLGNKKEYPKIETYFVAKKDKKYYVVPTTNITAEMSQAAGTAYASFMTTDPYKEYQKDYDAFVLKNPSFEEELATELSD